MTYEHRLPSGDKRIKTLEMCDITKRFPGVLANNCVCFDVRAGEVHALLGENGAGKSTLMNVLYGLYQQDEGEVRINGEPVTIESPVDAIKLGIGMIHQHFMLVPTLTVVENVALGLPSSRGFLTDLDRVAERIIELGETYGLIVDPEAYIWQLSVGQQQRVEIIKALYRGAQLLILDEPTAVLTPQEVEDFFVILRQMVSEGHAVIFISHKLHEVLAISDRVTVLRDGVVTGSRPLGEATREDLARMMVGRDVDWKPERSPVERGGVRLSLCNLQALDDRQQRALRGVDLDVHAGEILGLAGVSGNGQRELAQVVTGLRPASQGAVLIDGQDMTDASPKARIEAGISYIPEERMRDGMIKEFSVAENLILREHHQQPYSERGFLDFSAIAERSKSLIRRFSVKTPSQETPAQNLSGGNIQKLILAREISRHPRIIVAAQPTRGLDIGATEYVRNQLLEQCSDGVAILLISEDLDEILALSDRIAVIYEGQIMDILPAEEATAEQLGLLMAGVKTEETAETV